MSAKDYTKSVQRSNYLLKKEAETNRSKSETISSIKKLQLIETINARYTRFPEDPKEFDKVFPLFKLPKDTSQIDLLNLRYMLALGDKCDGNGYYSVPEEIEVKGKKRIIKEYKDNKCFLHIRIPFGGKLINDN